MKNSNIFNEKFNDFIAKATNKTGEALFNIQYIVKVGLIHFILYCLAATIVGAHNDSINSYDFATSIALEYGVVSRWSTIPAFIVIVISFIFFALNRKRLIKYLKGAIEHWDYKEEKENNEESNQM